jgi:hypothetical protein
VSYGKTETWKIVYFPKELNNGRRGVALVEAENRQQAMHNFQVEYKGQFSTVETCEKLIK